MRQAQDLKWPLSAALRRYKSHFARFSERFAAPRRPPNISRLVQDVLNDNLSQRSSDASVDDHFARLFENLESAVAHRTYTLHDTLAPMLSESQILRRFDSTYFAGHSTFATACAVLADPRIAGLSSIEHLCNSVRRGGTIMHLWAPSERERFQLHAANKLWKLGLRAESQKKLRADYAQVWRRRMAAEPALDATTLLQLVKALVATRAVSANDMVAHCGNNWRNLAAIWLLLGPQFPTALVPGPTSAALRHVSTQYPRDAFTFLPPAACSARALLDMALHAFALEHSDAALLRILSDDVPCSPRLIAN